jgi:disulfide bond formation protein DsbB
MTNVAHPRTGPLTWGALAAAALASGGSLWLSLGMNLVACPLCFYQRALALAALAVLVMGVVGGAGRLSALLALPSAAGGLAVAAFHVNLVRTGVLECPAGLLGLGSAPLQSLLVFSLLTLLLIAAPFAPGKGAEAPGMLARLVLALVLGGLMGVGCITSAPPLPPAPTKAYDPEKEPLKGCRRPFRP